MIWIVLLIGLAGVALGLGSSAASIVVVRQSPFETVWYFAPVFSVFVAGMLWVESPEGHGRRYR